MEHPAVFHFLFKYIDIIIKVGAMMNVVHNEQNQRFEVVINDVMAYLSYEMITDDILDYQHTIVPEVLGGQGVGKTLVKEALDYADKQNKKVCPSCSFIKAFIQKNAEYSHLVV